MATTMITTRIIDDHDDYNVPYNTSVLIQIYIEYVVTYILYIVE